jgi:hypothetical protein
MTLHTPRRQYNDAHAKHTFDAHLRGNMLYQKRRDSEISNGFLATQPIQVHGLLPQQTHTHTHTPTHTHTAPLLLLRFPVTRAPIRLVNGPRTHGPTSTLPADRLRVRNYTQTYVPRFCAVPAILSRFPAFDCPHRKEAPGESLTPVGHVTAPRTALFGPALFVLHANLYLHPFHKHLVHHGCTHPSQMCSP